MKITWTGVAMGMLTMIVYVVVYTYLYGDRPPVNTQEDAMTLSIVPHIETKPTEGMVAKDSASCARCKDTGWCDVAVKGLGYYCPDCEIGTQEWDKRHTDKNGKWKP